MLDSHGNTVGAIESIRDITDLRKAEIDRLQFSKLESLSTLAGGIAHDFNNILTVIHGNASLLLAGGGLAGVSAKCAQQISQAAERAAALTRQLLTFSRRQQLSPTVVDLNACIRTMRPMIESSLRGNIVYNEKIGAGVSPVTKTPGDRSPPSYSAV